MEAKGLEENTIIEIIKDKIRYKSIVQEVLEDKFSISIPVEDGDYLVPHIDDEIELEYMFENNMFGFVTKVVGRKIEGILPMLTLEPPTEVKKIQRRNFVRVSTLIKGYASLIESADVDLKRLDNKNFDLPLHIIEMSGGGIRIITKKEFKLKTLLAVSLQINNEDIRSVVKIVREYEKSENDFVYGLEFKNMQEKTRDKIIAEVFDIMRKHRFKQ